MHESFERSALKEAAAMKAEAEAKEDYVLRCIYGEKVFFCSGEFALLPGHIYSRAGRDEFAISKCCEYHFDRMFDEKWLEYREVTGGIDRVMYTVPTMVSYQHDEYEARYATMNVADADVVSSEVYGEPDTHVVALDIDVPARLVPSSTPGHHHLHIDVKCSWEDYAEFLRAAEKIGIIEPGYLGASLARKGTHLRLPWIVKTPGIEEQPDEGIEMVEFEL